MRTSVILSDVGAVLKNDAGGVGLFRSEFLYLENSEAYPDRRTAVRRYTNRLQKAWQAKKVIIRTLDIGADKQVDYFGS